jgi:hypothetical protein
LSTIVARSLKNQSSTQNAVGTPMADRLPKALMAVVGCALPDRWFTAAVVF